MPFLVTEDPVPLFPARSAVPCPLRHGFKFFYVLRNSFKLPCHIGPVLSVETRLGQAAPLVMAMVAEVEAVAEGPCEGP